MGAPAPSPFATFGATANVSGTPGPFGAPAAAAPAASPFGTPSAAVTSSPFGGGAGAGGGAAGASPFAPAPAGRGDTAVLRVWMQEVYTKFKPENVPKIERLLAKYT